MVHYSLTIILASNGILAPPHTVFPRWWNFFFCDLSYLPLYSLSLLNFVRTCEICHSIARNVVGVNEIESIEQSNETNSSTATAAVSGPAPHTDSRSFWHGHRFLNFLLACIVFAFVISWLFHFNVPS